MNNRCSYVSVYFRKFIISLFFFLKEKVLLISKIYRIFLIADGIAKYSGLVFCWGMGQATIFSSFFLLYLIEYCDAFLSMIVSLSIFLDAWEFHKNISFFPLLRRPVAQPVAYSKVP